MVLPYSSDSENELLLIDSKNTYVLQTLDVDSVYSSDHIFKDSDLADYYIDLYDKSKYECRHLFDPFLDWSSIEEKRITRKNDWNVTLWALIMFIALNFDRGNIGQALSDDLLDDLNMNTNEYNIGQTIFYLFFLSAELPSQLISKKIGSDIWVPIQVCLWSLVSISQAGLYNKTGFYITRALLGLLQGGFIADVCTWMSYFYTSKETPSRLSIFYIANPLTSIFSSVLSLGLLKISTKSIPEGWKWMFLIEGLITFFIGVISFFKMPSSVVNTKKWYRKKGWYTYREEQILVNKILRDDPSKGDLNNRKSVSIRELIATTLDYDLLFIYITRFLSDIGSAPVSAYLQILLRKMGYTTAVTNALSIPYHFLTIVVMFISTHLSVKYRSYAMVLAIVPIWIAFHLIILRYWEGAQVNKWGTWILISFLLGHPPTGPLSIGWCSVNANSVRSRTVSAAVVNIFSQAAGIVSSNFYREEDKPLYHKGNEILIVSALAALGWIFVARWWFIQRNRKKDSIWNAMSKEEQIDYTRTTTEKGNKRRDFRFSY